MRKLLAISLLLLVAACSTPKLTVDSMEVQKPPLSLVSPDPIVLSQFQADIMVQGAKPGTFGNSDAILKKDNGIAFSLSSPQYSNVLVDFAKVRAYISELQAEIVAYKSYYEPTPTKKAVN